MSCPRRQLHTLNIDRLKNYRNQNTEAPRGRTVVGLEAVEEGAAQTLSQSLERKMMNQKRPEFHSENAE